MSTNKDQLVGKAKKKIGELTKNEELIKKGQQQKETGDQAADNKRARIEELEDQYAEKKAKQQDGTKAQKGRQLADLDQAQDHTGPEDKHRLEAERLKHYTGIEEKL